MFTPHLKSLSWLPVKVQLYCRQAIMAFKCISRHAPNYLTSQFLTREQVTKRTTRSGQKLNIPLFKTASGQRTFYYRTIGLWNNLDPFLKSSPSVQVFKRILKNKLLDNFVNTSWTHLFLVFLLIANFRQCCECFLNLINFDCIVISNFSNKLNNCSWKAPLGR